MKKFTLLLSLLAAGALAGKASAVTTVYDNGPIDGANVGFTINFGFDVSDSFTLSSPTTITSAQLGLWLFPGDVPSSVDWSIGTAAEGSDIGSGTASLSNVFQSNSGFGFDLYESSFSLNESLGAGTYWLTIQNASTPSGDPVYWDDNNGPSAAFQGPVAAGGNGDLSTYPANPQGSGSESFQLFSGDAAVPTPEPVSATLLGLAGAGLIGYGAKRRSAKA